MAKWNEQYGMWIVKLNVENYNSGNVREGYFFTNDYQIFPSGTSRLEAVSNNYTNATAILEWLRNHGVSNPDISTYYYLHRGNAPATPPTDFLQLFPNFKGSFVFAAGNYTCTRDTVANIAVNTVYTNTYAYGGGFNGLIAGNTIFPYNTYGDYLGVLTIPIFPSLSELSGTSANVYTLVLQFNGNTWRWSVILNWSGVISNSKYITLLREWNGNFPDPPFPNEDPFSPGGNTEPGGGGMSGDPITSDPISFPSVPDIGAVDAGFVSIWTPTEKQVKNLAHYLWTTDITEGAFWRKLIQNPLELIFGLQILPVPIYHTDETGNPQEGEYIAAKDAVVLGWTKTGIKMDYIIDQYIEVDCGSIDMEEYWHAFLDYEPYTKIDIFLPYIGTKHLDTNDLMPRTLSLKYVIDIASGICVAMLKCDDSVYYQFTGNCASQIPLSVSQMQEIVKGAMSLAVGVGTFALGSAYGAGAHAAKQAVQTGTAMKAAGAAMVNSGLNSAAKGVNVSRSGTISAAAGLMGVQTPYLIISRPRQAVPEDQNTYTGYPSFITEDLGELNGYTEVQMIHLHEMSCTEDEFNEIDELLAAGVIF